MGWAATQTVAMLVAASARTPLVPRHRDQGRGAPAPHAPVPSEHRRRIQRGGFPAQASFFTFIFIGTLYMQQVLGFSALKTGLAWLTASITSVAFAGLSQMLVTKTSAKMVMAFGMALIGGGILWATQISTDGDFWHDLAGPFFVSGMGTAFAFIPVSIGALAGVTERDAGVASGLINTSQQLGGAIGVAVASSVAASHFGPWSIRVRNRCGVHRRVQWALWVCGLAGLVAVPVALLLIRRVESAKSVPSTGQGDAIGSPELMGHWAD